MSSEELTEFVVEEVTDSHEVVVHSEPSPSKKRRPPVDRTSDEYRRHRDRNNDAVRRCRQRTQQRNRDRQRMLEDVIEEKASLLARVMQLSEDLRQMSEVERRLMEDKMHLQEKVRSAERENDRLREHSRMIRKEVQELVGQSSSPVDGEKVEKIIEKSELLQAINRLENELYSANLEKKQLESNCDALREELETWRRKATVKSEEVSVSTTPAMIYQIVASTTPTDTAVVTSS